MLKKNLCLRRKKVTKKRFIPHFYSVAISSRPSVSVSIYFEDKHFVHLFVPCSNMFVPWPSYSTTDFLPVGDFVMYSRWVRPQDGVYCLFFLYVFPSFVFCCYRTLTKLHTHTRSLDLYRDAMMVMIFVLYSPSQLSVLNKVDGCEKTKEKKTKKIQSSHDAKLTKIVCFLFNFAGKQCTCFCRNVCWPAMPTGLFVDLGLWPNAKLGVTHITKSPGFNACRFMCLLASVLFFKADGSLRITTGQRH